MTTGTETPERQSIPTDTFEARLMLARLHAGRLSIRDAAERCGYTNESWSGWERGRRPSDKLEVAEVISETLGVDRDWLLYGGPLIKEERRSTRVLRRRRKEGAAAEPNVFYPATPEHTGCVPDRSMRGQPTPASQGAVSLSPAVKHTRVTHRAGWSSPAASTSEQRRTRRRNRPAS